MSEAALSPRTQEIEQEVTILRDALLQFGSKFNLLDQATADHGRNPPRPPHPDLSMETITLSRLLNVVHNAWDTEDLPEDETVLGPMEYRRLRALNMALLNFGFSLGREGTGTGAGTTLFTCQCRDPGCPSRNPRELETHDLLGLVENAWHEMAGCLNACKYPVNPSLAATADQILERNLHALRVFNERIDAEQDGDWEDVLVRYTLLVRTHTFNDLQKALAHGIDTHFKQSRYVHPEVDAAHRLLKQIPVRRGWDQRTTGCFTMALSTAINALLLRDIAAPMVFEVLYEPVNPKIPSAEINLALARLSQRSAGDPDLRSN